MVTIPWIQKRIVGEAIEYVNTWSGETVDVVAPFKFWEDFAYKTGETGALGGTLGQGTGIAPSATWVFDVRAGTGGGTGAYGLVYQFPGSIALSVMPTGGLSTGAAGYSQYGGLAVMHLGDSTPFEANDRGLKAEFAVKITSLPKYTGATMAPSLTADGHVRFGFYNAGQGGPEYYTPGEGASSWPAGAYPEHGAPSFVLGYPYLAYAENTHENGVPLNFNPMPYDGYVVNYKIDMTSDKVHFYVNDQKVDIYPAPGETHHNINASVEPVAPYLMVGAGKFPSADSGVQVELKSVKVWATRSGGVTGPTGGITGGASTGGTGGPFYW